MKLRFARLDCDVMLAKDAVTTLEIHDRRVFARIVQALISARGKFAIEPYLLFDEREKEVRPQNALLVVHSLPTLPLRDRNLLSKLYKRMNTLMELESNRYARIHQLAAQLEGEISLVAESLWGDYGLASEWSLGAYLKTYNFSSAESDESLLDNCIRFVDLCVDVAPDLPVVLVNAKSFFAWDELEILYDHVVFSGLELLLLESWPQSVILKNETKTVLDQHLCVA